MAVYKVPQDVEAEDKLLGPFSFRQFIYLIIVAIAGFVAWLLSQIFIGLIIIPLPVIIVFGVLALPLRKDQPMETYVAAVIRFYLKPKQRMWSPDGTISLVQILAPKAVEEHRGKDISQDEAVNRLSYLADVMDTQGWAARGVMNPAATASPLNTAVAEEAQSAQDILDTEAPVTQSFENLIEKTDAARREEVLEKLHQTAAAPTAAAPSTSDDDDDAALTSASKKAHYDPYPNSMRQQVLQPLGSKHKDDDSTHPAAKSQKSHKEPDQPKQTKSTSEKPSAEEVPADIMSLAHNPDLTISTIAHEAERRQKRHLDEEEVVISLH